MISVPTRVRGTLTCLPSAVLLEWSGDPNAFNIWYQNRVLLMLALKASEMGSILCYPSLRESPGTVFIYDSLLLKNHDMRNPATGPKRHHAIGIRNNYSDDMSSFSNVPGLPRVSFLW